MKSSTGRLYLVHRETGQRYPITGEVMIGRTSGDLVFARDTKLSNQHCKVAPGDGATLVVEDMDSANGTSIDGKRLTPQRSYVLRTDSELSLGGQAFTIEAVTARHRTRRRKKRKAKRSGDSIFSLVFTLLLIAACAGLGWAFWQSQKTMVSTGDVEPLQISQHEIGDIMDRYSGLLTSLEQQSAAPIEISQRLQIQVVNRLSLLTTRLSSIQPSQDHERQMLQLQQRYVSDLLRHAQTQQRYLVTADLTTQQELDRLEDGLVQAADQYRGLFKSARGPSANNALPAMVQSPFHLVEKEMRRALTSYRELGQAVRAQKISETQMAKAIREELIPKLNAVSDKLAILKPDTAGEKQRLMMEKKIIPAFVGQLKAMASYAISHDDKYQKQIDHWSSEIEKLNEQLKNQILRKPATK